MNTHSATQQQPQQQQPTLIRAAPGRWLVADATSMELLRGASHRVVGVPVGCPKSGGHGHNATTAQQRAMMAIPDWAAESLLARGLARVVGDVVAAALAVAPVPRPLCEGRGRIQRERVMRDLWLARGFWLSSPSSKYGADALVYEGDPERCHAKYVVAVEGSSWIPPISCRALCALARLCEGTKKTAVLASASEHDDEVHYLSVQWRG